MQQCHDTSSRKFVFILNHHQASFTSLSMAPNVFPLSVHVTIAILPIPTNLEYLQKGRVINARKGLVFMNINLMR